MKKECIFTVCSVLAGHALAEQTLVINKNLKVDSACTKSIDVGDGLQSTITMYYDSASDLVNFSAAVAPNSYVALGFGTSMFDTDMVYWL